MNESGASVFIKIKDYKEIEEKIKIIKNKLKEAKSTLGSLKELKNEEDSELELWSSTLEDIEKKISFFDESLNNFQHGD